MGPVKFPERHFFVFDKGRGESKKSSERRKTMFSCPPIVRRRKMIFSVEEQECPTGIFSENIIFNYGTCIISERHFFVFDEGRGETKKSSERRKTMFSCPPIVG